MIKNPYKNVAALLGSDDNHYKTDLHAHSTVSDANEDYSVMIKGFYDRDYDILGFADHGVIGKYWNEEPAHLPLYRYQTLTGKKVTKLTDREYADITGGSCPSPTRTKKRGMQCLSGGIELNMLTLTKSHVNGYFCGFGQNNCGFENGFEYAVKHVQAAGGISVINHPGDWLDSAKDFSIAKKPENVRFFGEIFNRYPSCLGMEVFNETDTCTRADRILWDALLQYVLPHGKRTLWGFANSDAHVLDRTDTSFMDLILPDFSEQNVKACMENGEFFAVGRRARPELGNDFVGTGAYPSVIALTVDEEAETIAVTAKNADKLQWIANGKLLSETAEKQADGTIRSTLRARDFGGDITCYVRFQLAGRGGICLSQPFILDRGDMAKYILPDPRSERQKKLEKALFILKSARVYVLAQEIAKAVKK